MKAEQLAKLEPGTRLKASKRYRDFWNREAWTMCTVSKGLPDETHAAGYFIRKAIAFGLKHEIIFQSYVNDVGNREPGAKVILKVGSFEDTTILGHTDVSLKKRYK